MKTETERICTECSNLGLLIVYSSWLRQKACVTQKSKQLVLQSLMGQIESADQQFSTYAAPNIRLVLADDASMVVPADCWPQSVDSGLRLREYARGHWIAKSMQVKFWHSERDTDSVDNKTLFRCTSQMHQTPR